ncbi:MAG: hypothetical protein J6I68_00830 [Butyrivibrio sp.]|uniref:hypothetical protein n=1 Tax=Butyrivibrio sp. TaxID=28121 RepID=UPI001B6B70A2|nr:hypothetical protein [Butyrivibrio sp.]MBP3781772.1 hypothetical protein [Butyrivibrio sp.]
MSVLARYRSESPFDTRDHARELEVRIIKLCMNEKYFPKRYRFILTMNIVEDAHKMVDFIEAANNMPFNKEFYKRRLTYQREAYARVEHLFRKFMLAERLGFTLPEGILIEIGDKLQKQEKLIANWIDSDKKRLGL